VIHPEQFLTKIQPITSAVEAYRAFDRHEAGWIKVKLDPMEQERAA
jgi:threonine dehydrogenase-like Zn-dependent dehydrogenase